MKKCVQCGGEYPDDMKFCGNCGSPLPENDGNVCGACGAKIAPDAKFCTVCGAKIAERKNDRCASCGAVLEKGSVFCTSCGTRAVKDQSSPKPTVKQTHVVNRTTPADRSTKLSVSSFKKKVTAFEKNHNVILNAFVMTLSLVFIFVALLCPVKVTMANPTAAAAGSSETSVSSESIEVEQSIWQVFGALGYLNTNINKVEGRKKITEIYTEYNNAVRQAQHEFNAWAMINKYVTEDEAIDKFGEIFVNHMSDVNIFGYQMAITSVGALDHLQGENTEYPIADQLDAMRATAVSGLVMALISIVCQLGIAITALIFLIFGIVGLIKKRTIRLFGYITLVMIFAFVGLAVLSIAPLGAPSGAMFALALTSVLTYFVCAAVRAFMTDKKPKYILRRVIHSSLAIVVFFLLCSRVISVTITMSADAVKSTSVISPLGAAVETLLSCAVIKTLNDVGIVASGGSYAGAIVAAVMGIIAFSLLCAAMTKSLQLLAFNTESNGKVDVFTLCGAVMLLAMAITLAIIGSADEIPELFENEIGYKYAISARSFVYVSMAFAICAFVFELVYGIVVCGNGGSSGLGSGAVMEDKAASVAVADTESSAEVRQGETSAGPEQPAEENKQVDAEPEAVSVNV